MKEYHEVQTLSEALYLARKYQDGEHGILLVQNVYKSDLDSNCIVIKYERYGGVHYETYMYVLP